VDYEKEIKEMYADIYSDEPQVGDWVIVQHTYNETIITGEVTALKHIKPQRGWQKRSRLRVYYLVGLEISVSWDPKVARRGRLGNQNYHD
jgi:hypothetical protein